MSEFMQNVYIVHGLIQHFTPHTAVQWIVRTTISLKPVKYEIITNENGYKNFINSYKQHISTLNHTLFTAFGNLNFALFK